MVLIMSNFEKIFKLCEEVHEEVEGAANYYSEAAKNEDDSSIHKLYLDMAKQEVQHAANLQKIMRTELDKLGTSDDPKAVIDDVKRYFIEKTEKDIIKAKFLMTPQA